jgi:hypothetical protein
MFCEEPDQGPPGMAAPGCAGADRKAKDAEREPAKRSSALSASLVADFRRLAVAKPGDGRSTLEAFATNAMALLRSTQCTRLRHRAETETHSAPNTFVVALCDFECWGALEPVLLATPQGRRLQPGLLRDVALGWVRLLRLAAAEGAESPIVSPAELTTLLTLRLHEALVRQEGGEDRTGEHIRAGRAPARAAAPTADGGPCPGDGFPLAVRFEAVGVEWQGRRLPLSPTEARIMALLLEQGFVSWAELLAVTESTASTLRVFLHRLKRKLEDAGAGPVLKTLKGKGVAIAAPTADPAQRRQAKESKVLKAA